MGLLSFLFGSKKEPPAKPAFVEKRLLPRWKLGVPAKIKWQGSSDYTPCEVRDLNMRGFSLAFDQKITAYANRAELYFNEKYFFDMEIEVTWHKELGGKQVYGAKFVKMRDSEREKLYRMMKENFPGSFGKL